MAVTRVNGILFRKMVINGTVNLKNNYQEIDELNVFPVPDGDTGTNMQMTMTAGIKEIKDMPTKSLLEISKMLSRGLLMGARGNSGVILSQFFRGIHDGLSKIANGSASIKEFADSLENGSKMAYRAVMDPKEGTILTVVREAAEKVQSNLTNYKDIESLLQAYIEYAHVSLENTPNLLPVLKEANVVDSGGAGFIKIVEGMLKALKGEFITLKENIATTNTNGILSLENVDIKFAYCTEFVLELREVAKFSESLLKDPYSSLGDSIVVVQDDNICKVHIHTNNPGSVMSIAQEFGDFLSMKVENMKLQHNEIVKEKPKEVKKMPKQKYAFIAVCTGEGIKNTFKELGVDFIIDGGQSMNPSTEDFVNVIDEVNADNIIILPNNSNIILAAEQSIRLRPNRKIQVLKNKSIASGYASLMNFDISKSMDVNMKKMAEVIAKINYGEITYSIRNTEFHGMKIKEGDYMGFVKGEIVSVKECRIDAVKELIDKIVSPDHEILTLFYGADVEDAEVTEVSHYITENFSHIELELIEGNQEIYTYIVAAE
ncbi:MAG: DAK2 domain-containing protein [Erysipelotrichales bacterium]|nr:DAK2 domain-containing protein [Erysipelotrichales bacterium]